MIYTFFQPEEGDPLPGTYHCPGDAPPPAPQITGVMVLRAFRQVPLPASTLTIAPPGGESLVNFDTIFSTQASRFQRTVTLLRQRVQLDITPSSYRWSYGDGASEVTDWPGRAYRASLPVSAYLSHRYETAGAVGPRVDTTWSARWRVGGGPWRPVIGTVTIQGAPVDLRIRTATPTLVGGSKP